MIEPWKLRCGYIERQNGGRVADLATEDAEEQIVMLRAREMFETLQYWASQKGVAWDLDDVIDSIAEDVAKIESEIAKAKDAK